MIASITQPFCGDCNRLRVTADGQAFTCLFAAQGLDLRPVLHNAGELEQTLRGLWNQRRDRYSEERQARSAAPVHAEMAYLGG